MSPRWIDFPAGVTGTTPYPYVLFEWDPNDDLMSCYPDNFIACPLYLKDVLQYLRTKDAIK